MIQSRNSPIIDEVSLLTQTGQGPPVPSDPTSVPTVVKYGTAPGVLNQVASGEAEVYTQIYNTSVPQIGGATCQNYSSPRLHNAKICGLTPGTVYFYQVGDGSTFSYVYNFTAVAAAGERKLLQMRCFLPLLQVVLTSFFSKALTRRAFVCKGV